MPPGRVRGFIQCFLKIACCPKVCLEEYKTTVPSSLYAGFTMVMMILPV